MPVTAYSTPGEFLPATAAFRGARPLITNPISTVAIARADGTLDATESDRWLTVEDDTGTVLGLAVDLPPRALLVSMMPPDKAAELAAYAAAGPPLSGVDGPSPTSELIARAYADLTGATVTPGLDQRLLSASTIHPPTGVPGTHRYATPSDRDLCVAWIHAFSREAVPDQPLPAASNIERRLAGPPTITLWTVDDAPVSLCWEAPRTAGVTRISAVYTPPPHRGHGYAAANVAATTQRALTQGATACMLYTDRTNPTSNRVYERIGYKFLADAMQWHLTIP